LSTEVKEYRDDLAQRILDLRRAAESRNTIQQRIAVLKRDNTRLRAQLTSLTRVRQMLGTRGQTPAARASGQN
jgi:uncharacterized small protein (DUF1192 family)